MILINKLYLSINAHTDYNLAETHLFGRKLDFNNGLNLVVGDNTSGKTTLAKCLYYALGMEELIEGKTGIVSLDKSVKDSFICNDAEGRNCQWNVLESTVTVQLTNTEGRTITIERKIKGVNVRPNIIDVFECNITEIRNKQHDEKYVHLIDDHNVGFDSGFYAYLSEFAGLPIVNVPSRNSESDTTLYMQTLFSLSFIEQTRGWSDFFATIRCYNIVNPKQRVVEYAMGYEINEQLPELKRLKNKMDNIAENWSKKVGQISSYLTYNNIVLYGLEREISKQKTDIDSLRFADRMYNKDIHESIVTLETRITEFEKKKNIPTFVDNGSIEKVKEYNDYKAKYDEFRVNLSEEKKKYASIVDQLQRIEEEIKRYTSLSKVNNVVTNMSLRVCPTCHQTLPVSPNKNFKVEMQDLDTSKAQLEMQKNFLIPLKKNLEFSINNKELYMLYLNKELNSKQSIITSLTHENKAIMQPLSDVEYSELADLKRHHADLNSAMKVITEVCSGLKLMIENYTELKRQYKEEKKKKDEKTIITQQQSQFKDFLFKFGYNSNIKDKVFLSDDKKTVNEYLPVVQQYNEYEESLRSSSSASDFIRGLWAYYLVLLKQGEHIPGFLVMDEPCQHSMKEQSLKSLFEICASITNRQIILFCSSQPHTEEFDAMERTEMQPRTRDIIRSLVENIHNENITYISIDPMAIGMIDE